MVSHLKELRHNQLQGSTYHSKVYMYEDLDTINYLATYKVTVVCMDGTQYSTTCESPENMNIAQTEND